MSLKTCVVVSAALIAELLFCALFLAALSMSASSWISEPHELRSTEFGLAPTESGKVNPSPDTSPSDSMEVATPTTERAAAQAPTSPGGRTELTQKIASMRDMHSRFSGALLAAASGTGTSEAVAALLPSSDRLMQEGLALMRAMKPGLPATETGEINATELTAQQSESVQDFLELMEVLIAMKGDRDSALKAGPGRVSPWTRESPAPAVPRPSLVRMQEGEFPELVS